MDLEFNRLVPCYCGSSTVVTRRPPQFDRYAVCSLGCWTKMVREGNYEPGSLFRG